MISLIICSRTPFLPARLQENIKTTIGVEYELIAIDNSKRQHSIFEAYNIGISKSQYPYLCFMHDDIQYDSQNWGADVLRHFTDVATGAIGIAGTPYYPQMPGSWWAGGLVNEALVHNIDGELKSAVKSVNGPSVQKNEVVVLDGVWLCIRRSIFENIKFDEQRFTGFHFYDMDICMQIHTLGFKLYSVSDILLQHFYTGTVDSKWIDNALVFQKKWRSKLPASVIKLTAHQQATTEYKTLAEYVRILLANKVSKTGAYLTGLGQIFRFYKGYPFLAIMILKRLTAGK